MNMVPVSITPKAIQDLLDELEASKQSRLRAWSVLQRLRMVLSDSENVAIPPPIHKDFAPMEHVLTLEMSKLQAAAVPFKAAFRARDKG